jgi:PTS system nitrogen regulatory IIA component
MVFSISISPRHCYYYVSVVAVKKTERAADNLPMPYRSMTLEELARMLGTDPRRLERMAQAGEVPCQKVGGQLRFNRATMTEWLQQHMSEFKAEHLAEVDAGMTAHRETRPDELIITPLLRPEAVTTNLGSRTKDSTLRHLISLAQKTGLVHDHKELLEAVMNREELCSTALGEGVAIPHPRQPLPYTLVGPLLVIARTSHGIAFGAPDGKLTDLFFLTASQDDRHHLHVLARLFRMVVGSDLLTQLREAATAQDMIAALARREQEVLSESA